MLGRKLALATGIVVMVAALSYWMGSTGIGPSCAKSGAKTGLLEQQAMEATDLVGGLQDAPVEVPIEKDEEHYYGPTDYEPAREGAWVEEAVMRSNIGLGTTDESPRFDDRRSPPELDRKDIFEWYEQFRRPGQLAPNSRAQMLLDHARDAVMEKEAAKALELLEKLLELEPDNATVHLLLGTTKAMLEMTDEAAYHYQRFLNLHSDHPQAHQVMQILEHFDDHRSGHLVGSSTDTGADSTADRVEAGHGETARADQDYYEHASGFVRRMSHTLFGCLREEVRRSGFAGKISFSFLVTNEGTVGWVSIANASLRGGEMQLCFEAEMAQWRFDAYEGEQIVVTHTFTVGS